MVDLKNKCAILTGGTQGLGLGLAKGLLETGVKVCMIDCCSKVHDAVKELSRHYPNVYGLQADLSEINNLPFVVNEAIELLGGNINILVNNAEVHKSIDATELPVESFSETFKINVTSLFELSRIVAAKMMEIGAGKIINIASVLAFQGGYKTAAYSSSKGALAQLTKSLSNEWASKGIQVNAIAPGYFHSEINHYIFDDPKRLQSLIDRIPTGRLGESDDLVGAVQFLASEKSNYISGIILPVDGGFLGR